MRKHMFAWLVIIAFVCCSLSVQAQEGEKQVETGPTKLAVLWTSGDPDVALKTCLMYSHAAKKYGWFEEVHLIVWGPSQRLLAADKSVQDKLAEMKKDGVIIEVCVACANSYGLVDHISGMGYEVKGMGAPLTNFLKDPDWAVLTY